jgi:hypothetical protein
LAEFALDKHDHVRRHHTVPEKLRGKRQPRLLGNLDQLHLRVKRLLHNQRHDRNKNVGHDKQQ